MYATLSTDRRPPQWPEERRVSTAVKERASWAVTSFVYLSTSTCINAATQLMHVTQRGNFDYVRSSD